MSFTIDPVSLASLVFINLLASWCLWLPMAGNMLTTSAPVAIGVGAYLSGYAALNWGISSVWVALLIGAGGGLLVGIPIGLIAHRVKDFALAIITLSIVLTLQLVASQISAIGGSVGMIGVPTSTILTPAIVVTVLVLIFSTALWWSRAGRSVDMLNSDEALSRAMGMSVLSFRVFLLAVASLVAGMDGVLQARYTGFLDPSQFGLDLMTELFAFVILGGIGSFWGPAVGATVLTIALQFLSVAGSLREIIFGGVLIVVSLIAPEGIVRRSQRARRSRFRKDLMSLEPLPVTKAAASSV
jgi:branched-chain amino acid transport system permease protein